MRRLLVLSLLAPLAGCFGAQYLGMIIDHKPGDPLEAPCKAAANGSLDDALCEYLGRPSTHVKAHDPAVVAAAALVDRDGDDRYDTPQAWSHAQDVDLDALDRTLAAAVHDREIGRAFLLAVRDRKQKLDAYVAAQSAGWRGVYIDPIVDVRARWARGAVRRAPWLAKVAPLRERADRAALAHAKDPGLLGELLALHRAYVADCRRAGEAIEVCLGDEVARPLTKQIVQLAWDSGDRDRAVAERALLEVPDVTRLGYVERRAATAAHDAAKAEREAWDKAVAEGRSASALHARWPVEPIEIDSEDLAGDELPSRDADHLDTGDAPWPQPDRAVVAGVSRRGDRALITFRRDAGTSTSSAECHETNRVDRIDSDGTLHYREECSGTVTDHYDVTVKPVTVPADEAAAIRPGEIVSVVADDHRRGHVIDVHAPDPSLHGTVMRDDDVASARVQISAFRLDAAPVAKAARAPR